MTNQQVNELWQKAKTCSQQIEKLHKEIIQCWRTQNKLIDELAQLKNVSKIYDLMPHFGSTKAAAKNEKRRKHIAKELSDSRQMASNAETALSRLLDEQKTVMRAHQKLTQYL